jgi:hypothetical protein
MNMFRTKWFGSLAGAMVLALSVVSAASAAELYRSPEVSSAAAAATPESVPAPIWLGIGNPGNPNPPITCNAWVVTNYWSDAAHTTKVGQCSITCNQYTQVTAYPTPVGGGTCTGVTSSPYTNQLTTLCRCVP